MIQSVKTITVTFLIAIYCIGINAVNHIPILYDQNQGSNLEHYISFATHKISSPNPNPENSTYRLDKPIASNYDLPNHHQWVKWQVHKKRIRNAYSQYILSSLNILPRYRKNDIIFPFHYFW